MTYTLEEYLNHYEGHYGGRVKGGAGTGEWEIKFQLWKDIGYKDGMSVLDYGSGWGAMLPAIKDHSKYVGVDIAPTAISMGQEYFPDATFEVMLPGKLELNKTFDFVAAQSVFTHTPKFTTLECLLDIKRHLKKGGFALIDVLHGEDNPNDIHVRYYDVTEWLKYIKDAGLKAEHVKSIQWPGGLHQYYKVTQ